MNKSGKSRFWVVAAIIVGATVHLASGQPVPDWYTYTDDFNDCNVENDSYYHSIFWPQGAFPPSEPYLYYKDTGELGFGDFHNQTAQLSYRFPFSQYVNNTISGQIQLEVRFPYTNAGSLQYSLSSDGIVWSRPKHLVAGTNIIKVESIRGICYITFYGIEVLIDNLHVTLNSYPADFFVKQGAILFPEFEFPTIQAAINHAQDGNSIEVAPGTYTGPGNTDIDFLRKAITVYSEKGPAQTIILCQDDQRGFYFHNAEEPNSVLRGFTINNGKKAGSGIPSESGSWTQSSAYPIGGGIYCEFSNPSIVDCTIKQCSTEFGGGIGLVGAAPFIADCIVQNCNAVASGAGIALIRDSNAVVINSLIQYNFVNSGGKGAGVYCDQSKALLSNCEIRSNGPVNNNSAITGGGIYISGAYTDIQLQKCLIADNIAYDGAGIYTDSINVPTIYKPNVGNIPAAACLVSLTNCTIANNQLKPLQATKGGGVHSLNSNTIISSSIIWGNQGQNVLSDNTSYPDYLVFDISYSDVQGGYPAGQGNINVDPLFASSAGGDYHLKSFYGRYNPVTGTWVYDNVQNQSPCIDAGDPKEQVGPEPYPNGKHINMGAYGGTTKASKNISPRIFHVAKTGNNSNSGLSKEYAFATIQKAVDTVNVEGDIIMIWPGVYTEDVKLWGTTPRRLTIQSADDAAEVRGGSEGIAFSFYSGQYSSCVLRNLIITNCSWNAIYCENASPTLTNLTIANNNFGINIVGSANPNIKRCIFANNAYGDIEQSYMKNVFISRLDVVRSIDSEQGNIDGTPGFFNPSASNGDYHLKSPYGRFSPSSNLWVTTDQYFSPCIDIYYPQDPSLTDPEREPRPNGGLINMGAYGGTPYASKSNY